MCHICMVLLSMVRTTQYSYRKHIHLLKDQLKPRDVDQRRPLCQDQEKIKADPDPDKILQEI